MNFCAAFFVGTHPGLPGIYSRLVRAFEGGPASHVELLFSDGSCASSTFLDGGVRFKPAGSIDFTTADWVLVPLPPGLEATARARCEARVGQAYDLRGNLRFIFPWGNRDSRQKAFCIELGMDALGFEDPWRYGVNAGMSACRRISAAHW